MGMEGAQSVFWSCPHSSSFLYCLTLCEGGKNIIP